MGQINELKDFTRGQLDAALMKIGQDAGMSTAKGIRAFLRGDLVISRPAHVWREEDGVIYFSVTSDGTTGEDWIKRLEGNCFRVRNYAKQVLRSPDFKPTSGVTTEIAVLRGMLFKDNNRITQNIRTQAYAGAFTHGRKLFDPNAEVACIIREKFTDKEIEAMGLWYIVAMHEPINASDGDPRLLSAARAGDGGWFSAYGGWSVSRWHRGSGFTFAVSQVSS